MVASQAGSVRCSHVPPVCEYRSTDSNNAISADVGISGRAAGVLTPEGGSGETRNKGVKQT